MQLRLRKEASREHCRCWEYITHKILSEVPKDSPCVRKIKPQVSHALVGDGGAIVVISLQYVSRTERHDRPRITQSRKWNREQFGAAEKKDVERSSSITWHLQTTQQLEAKNASAYLSA